MQNLEWYVNRLKSMDAGEIAWRLRGLCRDQLDLLRIPAGFAPQNSLHSHQWRTFPPPDPGFRCSPVSRKDIQSTESDYPDAWRSRLVRQADEICDNRLSYFDLTSHQHGWPFDWQRDHSANISGPLRLSILTDYRDFNTYGDCKLVWEPNRHHQLVVLARAWVVTGDRKFPDKVRQLMTNWIEANPFGYGMNWKSTLEHGIRVINWIWALDLIRDYDGFQPAEWQAIQKTLYQLIWDSQRRYSQGSSANNHLIGEAAGVFFGCCYLTDLRERDRWLSEAQEILEREILLQTYLSGCTREHAFGYQFFVLQFLHQCLLAGEQVDRPFSDRFAQRLHAMYRFMSDIVVDSGDIPNLNDRDDGYVLDLGETQMQPAALVSAGAGLFDDNSLRLIETETEFWLTGRNGTPTKPEKPSSSVAYADAGYFNLRNARASVFVDAAPLGFGPIAAHGHADCLSLTMTIDGRPFLVDSGTFDYFSDPESRDYFRSTRAHNTVEIDGENQSEMLGPFMWGRRAEPNVQAFSDSPDFAELRAEHDGYTMLADAVSHKREFKLHKLENSLEIIDRFECLKSHNARWHWHFASECELELLEIGRVIIRNGNSRLEITHDGDQLEAIDAGSENPLGWISPAYHVRIPSLCLVQQTTVKRDTTIFTRFSWQ